MDLCSTPIKWYTGEAHYYTGDKAKAVADNMKAFDLNPNNIYVLDRMGEIHQGLGDYKAAIGCYKRALMIKPDFENSQRKLIALTSKMEEQL